MFAMVLRKNDWSYDVRMPLPPWLYFKRRKSDVNWGSRVAWISMSFGFDELNPRPNFCASSMVLSTNSLDSEDGVLGEVVDTI
jgi:hypothetical protein